MFSAIIFISSSFLKDNFTGQRLLDWQYFFLSVLEYASSLLASLVSDTKSPVNFTVLGFPCSSAGKESTCNAGDLGSIPVLGRSPGEGSSYPLQYSGLENSMDCIVHGVSKSWTQLRDFHFHFTVVPLHDVSFSSYCFQDFLCLFQQFYYLLGLCLECKLMFFIKTLGIFGPLFLQKKIFFSV